MDTAVDVQLLTHTPDPIRVMYVAFRTCYSKFTPQQIWADIESGKISEEKMKTFIFDKLKSGHSSPRTQVYFTFAVSGLSRAASHQLVRHNNGITFDQQSQRYYAFKEGEPYYLYLDPLIWLGTQLGRYQQVPSRGHRDNHILGTSKPFSFIDEL